MRECVRGNRDYQKGPLHAYVIGSPNPDGSFTLHDTAIDYEQARTKAQAFAMNDFKKPVSVYELKDTVAVEAVAKWK